MTKSQLIERIAEKAPHLQPRQIEALVNSIFEQMAQSLKAGERIELRGFGCFSLKVRPARIGRNPKTGAPVALQRRLAVAFSAGKELRERINRVRSAPAPASHGSVRLPATSVLGASAFASLPVAAGDVAPRI
jgi:integration host factor subunit beta